MKSFLPIFLTVVALHAAEPDLTREAATHGDRTPADAYGGSNVVEQPLTPDAAKVPYLIPDAIAPGPFSADWKSFTADKLKHEPDWWREAKIGVWFHWGPQAMGRNGDWYARFLYQQAPEGRKGRANNRWMYDQHLKNFGHPSEFGYMDVLNAWKAPKFDAKKLMDLYAESGARYILVQGAHHDNFDLWNSVFQPWNSVNVGPQRDIVGELFTEARKHDFRTGMAFHADYSLWWFQTAFGADKNGPKAGIPYDAATRTKEDGKGKWWDGLDPKDLYGIDLKAEELPGKNIRDGFFTPVRDLFVQPENRRFAEQYTLKWFRRVKQFVDDYDPDMLYTDGTEPFTGRATAKGVISDATVKAVAHMYNKRAAKNGGTGDCMAVIKGGPRIPGIAAPHENGYTGPIKRTPWVWENTVGEWFYEENTLYDSRAMIFQMIEAISRDGNFNLNIGLTPEGDLEPGGVKMWQDFGEFTRRNPAAIYGSSAWKIIGEDAAGKDSIPRAFPSGPIVRQHAEFSMAISDVRFTQGKDRAVYAIIMAVPKPGETLRIRALGRDAKLLEKAPATVNLLGSEEKLQWKQEADALVITYPQSAAFPFAVGDVYNPGRTDCETPELYSIYPFRQVWLGTPEKLAMARQSFHIRNSSLDGTVDEQPVETGGWQSAPVQAAYLGLAREAARLASICFHDQFIHWTGNCAKTPNGELIRGSLEAPGSVIGDPKSGLPFPYRPRARFPAFWETKMDGTPDNDHGANAVNTLQAMLLQSHAGQIHLLPAWPEDWDVSFKLTAEKNTTVEGVYQNGRITELKVTPESRRKDIIDHSTPEARIKTLIDVACADRNWLFHLPSMLDGLPNPGPVTGPWIEKFGESMSNTRGTPWPGCTFRDNILYVHGKNPTPQISAKVVKQSALSDTLVKIEYDQPLEPIIRASISAASFTAGKSGTTIDLGEAKTFDRLEFTIDIPDYKRGQARSFRMEVLQPDGKWTTVHQGNLYGIIYSKRFPPVTASQVRLSIDAPITQFDVFPPGL